MLKISSLFSDHAVFQREKPIAVWGWCSCSFVQVTLTDGNGNILADSVCRANKDSGRFMAFLAPQTAGGAYTLTVSAEDEKIVVSDIYIGEVWLAGGQSNMEMPLKGFQLPLLNRDKLKFHAPVRMLTVPREMTGTVREDVDAVWTLPEGDDLENWSAAAAYFAAALTRELNVPVGILSSNWGGTKAEAWMSESSLMDAGIKETSIIKKDLLLTGREYWERIRQKGLDFFTRQTPYEEIVFFWEKEAIAEYSPDVNSGEKKGWHLNDFDDSEWKTVHLPGGWKAHGFFDESGVVWFRKKIRIPESWIGKKLLLNTGACDKQDITYVNGIKVGASGTGFETQYWNQVRSYEVPAEAVVSDELLIAVRVFSWMFDGGMIGPEDKMNIGLAESPQETLPLSGAWLAGAEILFPISCDQAGLGVHSTFNALYEEMILPLAPYSIKGAIWYQGESNDVAPGIYSDLMISLINDWRRLWRMKKLPFYQVLLAAFSGTENWPEIREAQIAAARATGTGFASAVDAGDTGDIHPRDKFTVGERLAAAALHDTYGMDIPGYGPEVEEIAWSDDDVKVLCRNAEGLHAAGGCAGGWETAGADGVFFEADAEIFGETILLSSPEVESPCHIRYAWHVNPEKANIYNGAGLPMIPCRFSK